MKTFITIILTAAITMIVTILALNNKEPKTDTISANTTQYYYAVENLLDTLSVYYDYMDTVGESDTYAIYQEARENLLCLELD